MQHAINWFEVPAKNFERAVGFYDTIFASPLHQGEFGGMPHGFFTDGEGESVGAVVFSPNHQPSDKGVVIYLNTGKELDKVISRVEGAGGKVVMPKTDIGQPGYIAIVQDSEGNRVGLHQPK